MSEFKGFIGMWLLILILVFAVLSIVVFSVLVSTVKIEARQNFQITLETDDRGTKILSFLSSGKDIAYIELIGHAFVSDQVDKKPMQDTIKKLSDITNKALHLSVEGKKISGNKPGEDRFSIPLPGLQTGILEVSE